MTTTPLISATVPAQEMPASPVSPQPADSPAFRDVLATQPVSGQDAAAGKDGAKAPVPSGKSRSGNTASTDKPPQAGKKTDDKKLLAAGDSTTAGPTLPGIALYIAAEANAALSHSASHSDMQTASDSQEAGAAGPGRSGGKPSGSSTGPNGVADVAKSLADLAAASAGAKTVQPKPAGAAGKTLSETGPEQVTKDSRNRSAASHDRTTSAATVTAASPAKTASAHPAGLPGTGPDGNPLHATIDPTHRTLVHTASDATPALLATTPATATVSLNSPAALTHTTPAISVPLQSPHWPGELGRQFVAIAQSSQPGQGHTAQLRLDPPNLGPLHIAIHVSDNVAQAVFFSPHAQVRQAVENALPQLQQQLAQAGIALGQASVSDQGTPRQAFSDDASTPRRRASGSVTAVAMAADSPVMPQPARTSTGNALVDTFA